MSNFHISTKNQFKETARYLQKKLSEELNTPIKLSTIQEALSISQGYSSFQHFISIKEAFKTAPTKAKYANGDINIEIQSLHFCMEAATGCSGTQNRIRSMLIHLYNNNNPTKIELKNFDETHTIHLLNVLALDSRPHKEIHDYIDDGNKIFSKWVNEAHENREYAKHRDKIYNFCETAEKIQGVECSMNGKEFLNSLEKKWEYELGEMERHIELFDISIDGLYCVRLSATDQFDYEYSVCVRFNLIEGLIYVCEESDVNESCESGLWYSKVNQQEIDEMQKYGSGIYLGNRNYFSK